MAQTIQNAKLAQGYRESLGLKGRSSLEADSIIVPQVQLYDLSKTPYSGLNVPAFRAVNQAAGAGVFSGAAAYAAPGTYLEITGIDIVCTTAAGIFTLVTATKSFIDSVTLLTASFISRRVPTGTNGNQVPAFALNVQNAAASGSVVRLAGLTAVNQSIALPLDITMDGDGSTPYGIICWTPAVNQICHVSFQGNVWFKNGGPGA